MGSALEYVFTLTKYMNKYLNSYPTHYLNMTILINTFRL